MNKFEFKEFPVIFKENPWDEYMRNRTEKLQRIYARSLIRGALMFDDFDWADDPWDYDAQNARKSGGT